MSDNLCIALLHTAGCSHRDLHWFFEIKKMRPQEVRESICRNKELPFVWKNVERVAQIKKNLESIDEEAFYTILRQKNIDIIPYQDPRYPERLTHISQIPYLLYVRGNLRETALMLAVVGTRKPTAYGKRVLRTLLEDLPHNELTIISGGAYGIDGLSHQYALQKKVQTLCVFGSGIDVFYPAEHAPLFQAIIDAGGALISSFPIGAAPQPYMFPVRNEIVAGLSDGVLIPEAGEKSGTLITAGLALEQGKEVFAVPGDIFAKMSRGCNLLIAKGEAKSILSSADILEEFGQTSNQQASCPPKEKNFNSQEAKDIYEAIGQGATTKEALLEALPYTLEILTKELSLLELEGHILLTLEGAYEYC